jgi:cytochrome c
MKRLTLATICLAAMPIMAAAEGDAAAGEKVFNKCKACHMVGDDAKNRVGPVLNGIVGRAVAAIEDFKYSDTLTEKGASGAVWTEEELAAFLTNPKDYAKGTKMAFPGLRKEEERANVIAYLATFSN